jgi:hypothetical protein
VVYLIIGFVRKHKEEKMCKGIKKYLPLAIAAVVGGWMVARRMVPEMMGRMMPKMMEGMMSRMMGGEEGFSPMEMCREMMAGMRQAAELAAYATPEVRALFEDWVREVEEAVLAFVQEQGTTDPQAIAEHLKISAESAIFFIGRLAREGRLRIDTVEIG